MLYRDYSRPADAWIPNVYGGRENLEAVGFLRHLNAVVARALPRRHRRSPRNRRRGPASPRRCPTGWASPSNGTWAGCTTRCATSSTSRSIAPTTTTTSPSACSTPSRRNSSCRSRTTRSCYGKGSLLGKMPGDRWQRFANLRAYLGFMWAHPGKKLLFMGSEIAQEREWNHDAELDWPLLGDPMHAGIQRLVRRPQPALRRRAVAASARRRRRASAG